MKTTTYRDYVLSNRQGGTNDWFVKHGARVRWGTLAEVKADVDHIYIYGHLPAAKQSWA